MLLSSLFYELLFKMHEIKITNNMEDAHAGQPSSLSENENPENKHDQANDPIVEEQYGDFFMDEAMEKTLNWKCDLKLLPPLICLFMITFVDRTNIANAKIEGMTTDLKMKGNDYNTSLWILNIPYICLAIPSNLLMKKGFVKPSVYLSSIMFCWALCTIGLGCTKTFKGVLACRFLMGAFESGFVPGCAYLISRYYKRRDFSVRYAAFFGAAVLAGAFGGFLAYAIEHMNKVGGYAGWRWIFIIEGCITIIGVGVALLCIPSYPEDSTFLKPDEKQYLLAMLREDAGPSHPNFYSSLVIKECLFDPKIWLGTLAYFGADNAASSIVSFQPTILKSLGYSNAQAQVHTIPVYIVALCALLICAYLSGRLGHRYGFLIFGAAIGIVGWSIELAQVKAVSARYFGMFAITASAYIQMPILVAWLSNNMGGNAKAAFATGFMIGIGNCGNLVSSNVFITDQSPRYRTGFATGLGLNILGVTATTSLEVYCWLANRRRDAGREDSKLDSSSEVLRDLGDDHPDFRYIL